MVNDYLIAVACVSLSTLLFPGSGGNPALAWPPALLWPVLFWREGLYPGYSLSRQHKLRAYVMSSLLVGLVLAALQPALMQSFRVSPLSLAVTAVLAGPAAYAARLVWQRLLLRLGIWGRPIVIMGAGNSGQRIAASLLKSPLLGLRPVAFFDDDRAKRGKSVAGIPVVGALSEAEDYARRYAIRHAVVAIPRLPQYFLGRLTSTHGRIFKRLQVLPDLPGVPVEAVRVGSLDNRLTLEVRNNLWLRRNQCIKRLFDLGATIVGGFVILPILLLLGLAIRLDSAGPILYSQERIGRKGHRFRIWKFRSMVVDADDALARHLAEHPELRAEWEVAHKLMDDPRVTRVGAFLRKTSLDELPQLLNVLRGEMSLVGPRPIVEAEIEKYADRYDFYTLVRPGMTGYWQVSGRSAMSYAGRVELDEYYSRNWSLWFDLIILCATGRVVLKRDGAC